MAERRVVVWLGLVAACLLVGATTVGCKNLVKKTDDEEAGEASPGREAVTASAPVTRVATLDCAGLEALEPVVPGPRGFAAATVEAHAPAGDIVDLVYRDGALHAGVRGGGYWRHDGEVWKEPSADVTIRRVGDLDPYVDLGHYTFEQTAKDGTRRLGGVRGVWVSSVAGGRLLSSAKLEAPTHAPARAPTADDGQPVAQMIGRLIPGGIGDIPELTPITRADGTPLHGEVYQFIAFADANWVLGDFGLYRGAPPEGWSRPDPSAIGLSPPGVDDLLAVRDVASKSWQEVPLPDGVEPALMLALDDGRICLLGAGAACINGKTLAPAASPGTLPKADFSAARTFARGDDGSWTIGGLGGLLWQASADLSTWTNLASPAGRFYIARSAGESDEVFRAEPDGTLTHLLEEPVSIASPWPHPERWNGAAIDPDGRIWLVGPSGRVGRLDPGETGIDITPAPSRTEWVAVDAAGDTVVIGGNKGRLSIGKTAAPAADADDTDTDDVDKAERWRDLVPVHIPGLDAHTVFDVQLAPDNPEHLWLGTAGGAFVSRDGGKTFCGLATTETMMGAGPARVGVGSSSHVAIQTPNGVFVSKDGGASFTNVYAGSADPGPIEVLSASELLLAHERGLGVLDIEAETLAVAVRISGLTATARSERAISFAHPKGASVVVELTGPKPK